MPKSAISSIFQCFGPKSAISSVFQYLWSPCFHSMYIVKVASRQRGKFGEFVSGGQGDADFHSMYIVRVASRQREIIDILVFSGGQGDANFHSMYIVRVASR